MKNLLTCLILFAALPMNHPGVWKSPDPLPVEPAENLFIITIDGFRWQEVFTGADESLLADTTCTPDPAMMKMMYWDEKPEERRKKLLPFFWNIIGSQGCLYGNRNYNNKVNTANLFRFSYPGYNEIFTGNTDILVSSNKKRKNSNVNVLEYLHGREGFKDKVVAFTSWDVFPYILNKERNGLLINSGYECIDKTDCEAQRMISQVQTEAVYNKGQTRYDQLTFLTAKEYVQQHKPRVVYIGLGETDEYAHSGRYDLYLDQANKIDRMLAELWLWVQTTPGYRNNTTFLITTDHGRGSRDKKWTSHGAFIKGSSQTWMALLGPGIEAGGEMKENQQFYQEQIANTIAALVGETFDRRTAAGNAITSGK